jgi:hypothetical protein
VQQPRDMPDQFPWDVEDGRISNHVGSFREIRVCRKNLSIGGPTPLHAPSSMDGHVRVAPSARQDPW